MDKATEQALFYRNNRQLVTVEITKPDNTTVNIESPFMAIELEQSMPPLNSFCAQILTFSASRYVSRRCSSRWR
jgi:hypothetical protein